MNDRNNKSSGLFTPSGCLTGDVLMLFVTGSLKDPELTIARQHVAECPLCNDAAEGLKMWLKENEPGSDTTLETNEPLVKDLPVLSAFKKSHTGKFTGKQENDFHVRTDVINERIRQRLHTHALLEANENKRLSYKPFVWLAAAATLVLFIGSFYVIWVQNKFDYQKQTLNSALEMERTARIEDSLLKSTSSDTLSIYVLAMNEKNKTERKQSPVIIDIRSEDVFLDSDNFLEEQLSENKASISQPIAGIVAKTEQNETNQTTQVDTSVPKGFNIPNYNNGVVVTALGISRDKKALGYSSNDSEKGYTTGSNEIRMIKSRSLNDLESEDIEGSPVFTIVEEMPQFPGGEEARIKFLTDNIVYPRQAAENGIQGAVYVSFIVSSKGIIENIKILRGIGGGCDEEALRVLEKMPRWKPGRQNGKPVRVLYNMPVYFKLQG